ncbi:uncharacterized protein LOC111899567 [Lactuca sativa]|uniref:uncharacterized protein LOC111899567 n=1 Tax=Lactuca sativa TaxID=4236 RepID=UPI001C68B247|nr:uncharacterized protein LOC111899567 [Lactuca sativa]
MTRGSNTPLVPPLDDPESALKNKGKIIGETTSSKSSPLKNLKSVFNKKKSSKSGASSASIAIEDPIKEDTEYETEEEEALTFGHDFDSGDELAIIMANIDEVPMGEWKKKMRDDTVPGLVQPAIPATATFELKGHIPAQLKEIPFYGKDNEDAFKHLDEVNDGLFAARKDMAKVAELVLDELPEKKGDPGSISIPCQFGNILATQVLTNSGASINLMPYSFFEKLNLPEPRTINMKIHLADKTIIRLRGVCEDLLIKVDKFVFPVDFVVLDMEEDPKIPIILGRPFLNTACALIDVCESTLTLRVGDKSVVFKAIQEIKQEETRKEEVSSIDLDDELLQKEFALLEEEDPTIFWGKF